MTNSESSYPPSPADMRQAVKAGTAATTLAVAATNPQEIVSGFQQAFDPAGLLHAAQAAINHPGATGLTVAVAAGAIASAPYVVEEVRGLAKDVRQTVEKAAGRVRGR